MANFNKLIDFINDKSFTDYANADKLDLDSRFNSFVKTGSVYSIKSELSKIQGVVKSNLGFDDVTITSDKGVANIMFHHRGDPDGSKGGSFSFSLGKSADGMVYLNGMPQTNMATYTQINGKGALVSSTTMALKSVGDALRQYSSSWQKLDSKTIAKKAQSTINIAIRDQLKNNVSLDNSSRKDTAEMFDPSKFAALTPESKEVYKQRIIVGNFLTKFYNDTVKKASSYSKRGKKPSNESEYRKQVENIMAAAFGGVKGQSLEKIIKQNDAWMYDQVWNQGLSEFVNFLSKSGVVQGGIDFGNYDVIATAKRSLPMINAVSSDKISKAGRFLKENQKQIEKSKAKIGTTNIWTEKAHQAYTKAAGGKNNFQRNTLYGFSEISEDVIVKVRKQIQNELKKTSNKSEREKLERQYKETLIGLGKDASLMTDTLARDFVGISEKKEYFTNGDILELNFINAKIKEKIEKNLKNKNKDFGVLSDEDKEKAINKEFDNILEVHKNSKTAFSGKDRYDRYVRNIIQNYLNLDKNERIGGKNTGYTLTDRGITNVQTFQKRAYNSLTTRSNTSDFRSVITAISDGLMVRYLKELGFSDEEIYKNPKNPSEGLKVNALSQKEELSGKNIRDRTYGTLEYAISQAQADGKSGEEIEGALKKAGWSGIINYNKDKDTFFFNNDAFDKKFLHKKKSGKGFDLADSLIGATEFAKEVGAYNKNATYYERVGGNLIQLRNAVIARELHMAAVSDYEGSGGETESKFTVTKQTAQTARGNVGDMARLYDEKGNKLFSQEEIAAMKKTVEEQENLLKEGDKKLETHRKTLETSNELWKNHGKDYSRLGVATLTARDLQDIDTELNYINDNEASGLRKNGVTLEERLKEIREKYYRDNKKELEEYYPGQSPEAIKAQIEVIAELGEKYLYDSDNNRLTSRLSFFHGKQLDSPDPSKYSLDEAATANMRIANLVKEMSKKSTGSEDVASKSRTYGRKYVEIVSEIADSVNKGGIYKSLTRASVGKDSGWLKLTALAEGSEDVFKYILQQRGIDPNDESKIPAMVMNASNAKEALHSIWSSGKDGKNALNQLRESLEAQNPAKHKIKGKGDKYKNAKDVDTVNYLVDRFTLESENYVGGGLSSQYLRHPVIKGYSDIMGGMIALTRDPKLAEKGTLRLSRAQADIQKGDMDGDKVAMKLAILNGDQEALNSALASYTKHYAEAHEKYLGEKHNKALNDDKEALEKINKLREEKGLSPIQSLENYGKLSDINSPADSKKNSILGIAQGIGRKGAGIYGDEVKAALNIAEKFGVGGEGIGINSKNAVFADLATNIFHTLYQEGINIKNAKIEGLYGAETEQIAQNVLDLSGKASTWKDFQQMENFLTMASQLGAGKADKFFSDKQMADMHLADFSALGQEGKDLLNDWFDILDKATKNAKKRYGSRSKKAKLLQQDLKQLQAIQKGNEKGFKSLSIETIAALATSDSFQNIFRDDKTGNAFGDYMESRYTELGILRPDKVLNNRTGKLDASFLETEAYKALDEGTQKAIKKTIYAQTVEKDRNPFYQKGEFDPNNGKILSPTRAAKNVLPSIFRQVGKDLLPTLLPKGEYNETEFKDIMENATSSVSDWSSIKTILKGNIAHKAAEVLANITKSGEEIEEQEIDKKISDAILEEVVTPDMFKMITSGVFKEKDPDGNDRVRQVGVNELNEFISKQILRGKQNFRFLQKRADEGEETLGAELGIPMLYRQGKDGVARGRGVIDYLSKTDRAIKVYDYKNYASGTPSAENILQLLDYANMLELSRDMIKNEGPSLDFISFLGTGIGANGKGGNRLAQSWQERLYDLTIDQLRGTQTQEQWKNSDIYKELYDTNGKRRIGNFEEFLRNTPEYEKAVEEQKAVYNTLKTEAAENIESYIISTSDLGITTKYKVNTTSQESKNLYKQYTDAIANGETMASPDKLSVMAEFIKNNPNLITAVGPSTFTGDIEDFKKYKSPELQKIIKLGQDKANLEFKREELATLEKLNETEIPEKQKALEFFDEQRISIDKLETDLDNQIKAAKEALQGFKDPNNNLIKLTGENGELLLSDRDLEGLTNIEDERRLAAKESALAAKESKTYKQQYKDNYREELKYEKQLVELKNQKKLSEGSNPLLDLENEEKTLLDEKIADIEEYLVVVKANRKIVEEEVKKLPGGEETVKKYKSLTPEELDKLSKESYINQSITLRNKNENLFSTGQSAQQRVLDLQRQIEAYDKDLNKKGLSSTEKALIEKLRHKSTIELARRQEDLSLYDQLYGIDGTKYSDDYMQGKNSAIDSDFVQKKQRELQEKANWENDAGFMGMDAPTIRWLQNIMTGGGVYTLLAKFKKGLNDIIQKAIQLDAAMTNLRIVTGDSAAETRSLIGDYSDLAKQLGVTTIEVASGASEWLRQGYEVAEVNDLITASTYLSKLGMIDSATATKDLTSALKGFKLEASDAMDIVDKLTALDVEAATTAGDIAEGLAQFANLATLNGVDIDQASAYVATIADVTQQSGNSVGNAMKTIMSRYGNVKASAYDTINLNNSTDTSSDDLNDVEKILTKLGISMRDTNLEFKDFDEILDEIAGKWTTLDTVSKRAIANAFAGTRQQEAFLSLLENYDTYQDFVKTSQNSEGTAEIKYQSYQESYEATKNSFTAAIEDLANNSSIIHTLEDLTKAGQWLVEGIDKIAKYLPTIITQVNSIRGLWGRGIVQRGAEVVSKAWKGKSSDTGLLAGIERTWGLKFRSSAQKLADARKGVSEYESARKDVREYEKTLIDVEGDRSLFTKEENETYEKNLKYLKENAEAYKKNQKVIEKANNAQIKQTEAVNTNTTATKQDSAAENVETQENVKAASSEKAETAANQQAAGSSGSNTGGFNKTGAILAGLNIAASGITNAVTSYATQATTHTNSKGEEVESSEEAQKVGASVSAIINSASGIPIIGGIVSVAATKVGEKIAASIDKERDEANILAEEASSKLSALSGIESDLETIGEDVSSIASQEAVSELMNTLYSEDGEEAREELAKYLGGESALFTTLMEIKDGNEESFKKLQAAQLEAKKAQVVNQYASQMYKNNEAVNDAYNNWQDYSGYTPGVIGKSIGVGTGGSVGSMATGALVGAAGVGLGHLAGALGASALASTIPVAGWIIGAGIALTGVVTSIYAAVKYAEVKAEEERAANAAESEFLSKSTSEKITQLNSELLKAQAASDSEAVDKINTLISALETQNALVAKIQDEINDITLEQGLLYASTGTGSEKQYLSDMTTAQLKNLGIDEILTIFAQGLEQAGGLIGEYVWADDAKTQLSDAGYDLLKKKLYNLDDEEINSVLSGSSRTLSEVLSMKDGTKEKNALLSNFATALGVPKSDLESLRDLFGSITYAEAIMSTSDLSDRIDGYDSLINSITNGAGDVSGWMQTIISDYPELIAYMGDTPTLFTKITEKLKALNQVYLSSAFSEVLQNTGTYDETKASFYEVLNDDSIKATLDAYGGSTGVTSYADIWSYIQTQIQEDGSLTEAGQKVYDALKDTFEAYGISVTADKLSSQFKSVISYQSSLLDDQINNLTEQKEALQNINSQREYENKLIEAKLKLENASKEKKRVYRAGVGWVYEADQASIKEAQENLESVETEKTISSLDSQITELQAQKEELNNIYTEINNANLKANFEALLAAEDGNASSMDTLIDWVKKGVAGVTKTGADAAEDEMKTATENKQNAWTAMQEAWDILQDTNATDAGKYNTALQNYISKATAAKSAGVTDAQMNTLGDTTILGKNMSAADVLAKGYESLKSTERIALTLKDSSGSYTGTVGFEAFSSNEAMGDILSQLKNGKGTIWDSNKKVVWKDGNTKDYSDYRYGISSDLTSLIDYIATLKGYGIDTSEFVFSNGESGSGNEAVYYSNGAFYKVQSTNSSDGKMYEGLAKAAMGSLGLRGGLSLINELGTEAIVTPSGTVTALPSATGVVPADITRNLWELGEVAPALLKTMQATITPDTIGDSILSSLMSDESTNINTINMNVNADSTFDANKFINSVKSRVALTRNSSK